MYIPQGRHRLKGCSALLFVDCLLLSAMAVSVVAQNPATGTLRSTVSTPKTFSCTPAQVAA